MLVISRRTATPPDQRGLSGAHGREFAPDALERLMRRWTAIAWLLVAGMAMQGAWHGRHASGRGVGRAFSDLPAWYFAAILPPYLGLVIRLWRPLPLRLSPSARLLASTAGVALSLAGLGLVVWGRVALGKLYNVSSTLGTRLYAGHQLVISGPFALVRHPMYLGALVAGVGGVLLYRTWTTVLILAHEAVFCVRAGREEQALAAEFGASWWRYARRVPAGVPVLGAPHEGVAPAATGSSSG